MVPTVAPKWRDLGIQLLDSEQQKYLNTIHANHPNNVEECCKLMFAKWLDTETNASWNQLIEALKSPSLDLLQLAKEIEQNLLGTSVYIIMQ